MKSSDIVLSLIIIFIYIGLLLFNILSIGIKKIKENWPEYRCRPTVIPFANFFGEDTKENLEYCIQNMAADQLKSIRDLLGGDINIFSTLITQFNETLGNTTGIIGQLREFVMGLVEKILDIFMNIIIGFQKILFNLKDVLSKMGGLMALFMNLLNTVVITLEAVWTGPPGALVRSLCFAPTTKIELASGDIVHIKDMPLNAKLKNGSIVQSVMKISNINNDGSQIEKMYSISGGVGDDKIIVSGSHLIYDSDTKTFIKVKNLKCLREIHEIKHEKHDILYCLITSDHIIPIGKHIFHDWEDNNGSPSKSLV